MQLLMNEDLASISAGGGWAPALVNAAREVVLGMLAQAAYDALAASLTPGDPPADWMVVAGYSQY